MTLSSTYGALGDALRRQYGTTDKYSLHDMAKLIDGLDIHNYLTEGQSFITENGDHDYKDLKGLDTNVNTWQPLAGKTIAISFDVTWSGFTSSSSMQSRTGIEYGIKFKNNPELWAGTWLYPSNPSGSQHVYGFYHLPDDKITSIEEGCYFNQMNGTVKATNFKIVVIPLNSN